jgi:hypothetical protein
MDIKPKNGQDLAVMDRGQRIAYPEEMGLCKALSSKGKCWHDFCQTWGILITDQKIASYPECPFF